MLSVAGSLRFARLSVVCLGILLACSPTLHASEPGSLAGAGPPLYESSPLMRWQDVPATGVVRDDITLDAAIVGAMTSYHIPGVAACVVKDGQVAWHKAYGFADVERGIVAADSTVFMLASISKTFVATALMQLWEDDLFELDDDVNDYLPFPVTNPHHPTVPITFRQILSHTSSIAYNHDIWLPLIVEGADSPLTLEEYLSEYLVPGGEYYSSRTYKAQAPGTVGEYSNNAYALAGYLVERISGQDFEQYCQENIFAPLGMHETSWFLAGLDEDDVAMPTGYDAGAYFAYGQYGFPVYPAGQLRTSSLQLARHLIAFMEDGEIDGVRILEAATVEMMRTVQYPSITVFPGYRWGLGWYMVWTGSEWLWGHEGGVFGVCTLMYYDPLENHGIIYLTNTDGGAGHGMIFNAMLTYAESLPDATPVLLSAFAADRDGSGARVTWEITAGGGMTDFRLWRHEIGREPVRLGETAHTGPGRYEFVDVSAPAAAVEYRLQGVDGEGTTSWLGTAHLSAAVAYLATMQPRNHPNPFNPRTTIFFELPRASDVELSVYDLQGRRVATLISGARPAGPHSCHWNGRNRHGADVAGGLYLYRLQACGALRLGKMTLSR